MKYLETREKLLNAGLTCFTPLEFQRVIKATSKIAARKLLERYTQKRIFSRPKNGLYVFNENRPSLWMLANKIYAPSYISMETALSYYGIIPETVYTVTSMTSKITRNFEFEENNFLYRKIKRAAFTGYGPVVVNKETVLLAEPEKALADYLYFVFLKNIGLNERLRWRKIKKSNLFRYIKIFDNKKFERWAKDVVGKQH